MIMGTEIVNACWTIWEHGLQNVGRVTEYFASVLVLGNLLRYICLVTKQYKLVSGQRVTMIVIIIIIVP